MGAGAEAAGEGVAGTAGAEGAADGAGADGAAGVEAAALEGVEGACEGVAADEGALGCIRWYGQMQCSESFQWRGRCHYLRYHAYYETLLLNVVCLDGLVILEDFPCELFSEASAR